MAREVEETDTLRLIPRQQNRIALIAAGAALLGGVFGVFGALAGLGASVIQANTQRDLAAREEIRTAYGEVSLAMVCYLDASRRGGAVEATDSAGLAAAAKELCARSADLQPAVANAQLLGSHEAFKPAADAVEHASVDCQMARRAAIDGHTMPDSDVDLDVIAFIIVARKELGTGPL